MTLHRLRWTSAIGGLLVAVSAVASCSSEPEGETAAAGGGGAGGAPAGGGGSAAASGGGGPEGIPCDEAGVSKGPWVQRVDGESARIRWEACRNDSGESLAFAPEGGGAEKTVTGTAKDFEVTTTYRPLDPNMPADLPGIYTMHEVKLTGLSPATCYRYHLETSPDRKGRFCTAREPGDDLRFFAIGDTSPGFGDYFVDVLKNTMPKNPDFTVHGGDIQYYLLETWAYWFQRAEPLLSQGAFYPAIGNHESEQPDELDAYVLRFFGDAGFTGDSGHYTFASAGVHFFALDTEESVALNDLQGTWLAKGLSDAAASPGYRFSVLYLHRPFVTCGDSPDDPVSRAALAPLFAEYKVPLVLQAHMHGYERFEIDGVTYVTSGGGGGDINDVDENIARDYCGMRVASGGFRHGMIFDVTAGKLSGRAIDDQGSVRDSFEVVVP